MQKHRQHPKLLQNNDKLIIIPNLAAMNKNLAIFAHVLLTPGFNLGIITPNLITL
jgi:hypothetical protein